VIARPVQTSLIEGMDRPVGPLPPSVITGTNADLIARIAPLYLTGSVLDVTYGRGGWWRRFRPEPFTFHDIELDGVDFTALPHADRSFDAVCFDPPYIPQGGTNHDAKNFHEAFGLRQRSQSELYDLFADGIAECARVTDQWLLVKCMDYVNSGRLNLGHMKMIDFGKAHRLSVHDLIIHHSGGGLGGWNVTEVKRAQRVHSYLIVFDAKGVA